MTVADAPFFFDDLILGDRFDTAPRLQLNLWLAAVHHAILDDRLRLPLAPALTKRVTGSAGARVSPRLDWDIAIGQAKVVALRVIAKLFYRGLAV